MQRVDEIAQAGLDHKSGIDRPDIRQPVDAEQDRRSQVDQQHPPAERRGPKSLPLAGDKQDQRQQNEGPDDAVRDQLDGRDGLQPLPIDREDTPCQICTNPV